jgi:hypothetical protein
MTSLRGCQPPRSTSGREEHAHIRSGERRRRAVGAGAARSAAGHGEGDLRGHMALGVAQLEQPISGGESGLMVSGAMRGPWREEEGRGDK